MNNFSRSTIALLRRRSILHLILLCIAAAGVVAQENGNIPPPHISPEIRVEEDPTRPVFFSVRNEYRDLKNGAWANTVLLRVDKLSFRNLKNEGGMKGLIFRVDVPMNTVHRGTTTKAGLGDVYGQLLYVPHVRRKFAFAIGTGVVLPTATNDLLGQGKLILAPAAAPVWYFAKRKRIALIRFQNFFSVAGKSSRPDVNYFIADPTIIHPIGRRWWTGVNTEFKWDWKTGRGSGTTGAQVGRMVHGKFGIWVKPEIPWGRGRTGGFNLKFTMFRVR